MPHAPAVPLAAQLDGLEYVFARIVAEIAAADDVDPRLAQTATAMANAIVRIVQAQDRLVDPDAEFNAEVHRARAELGLLPGFEPQFEPAPATNSATDAAPDPDDRDPTDDPDDHPDHRPPPHPPAPSSGITPPTLRSRTTVARPTRAPPA